MTYRTCNKQNMDERFVKKLLVPSFIVVILSTTFFYKLKCFIDFIFFKKKHFLIIGILSSPENFQQRLSIRKTWLRLLTEISGSYHFIIGNEICGIPPLDRADPYSCIDKPFFLPQNVKPDSEFTTVKIQNKDEAKVSVPSFIGFGFYVRNKILIKKLGILKELLKLINSEVQVKLISAFDKQILASVTFSSDLLNYTNSDIITKAIKPVILISTYEAFVKLEISHDNIRIYPNCEFALWENKPNVINFISLWQEGSAIPMPFNEESCSFVFMTYNILDLENLKEEISNRYSRLKEWQESKEKLYLQLKNESMIFNDLIFLNVVDVYRNLGLKMVNFYKRILETEYFHYVLKTDDDSFIDLIRVYNQLITVNKEIDSEIKQSPAQIKENLEVTKLRLPKFWWWSSFKESWKVQRSGKWRDYFRSASYPIFPCGGGYVINKHIVNYIVSNEHVLNYFQGEDVSIGIWLASLPVTHYKIPKVLSKNKSHQFQKRIVLKFKGEQFWSKFISKTKSLELAPNFCEWTCNNKKTHGIPLCNKVQLNVSEMYNTWSKYIEKGFL